MPHHEKSIARLLQGAVFFGAILVAPGAFAHDYGNDSDGYHRAHAVTRHHHPISIHATDRHSAMYLRRHRSNRDDETAYLNERSLREATYESRDRRAQIIRADYAARARNEARQTRREEFALNERERPVTAKLNLAEVRKSRERVAEIEGAADERERSVTAELNLVQLREGRERAAEMAQWQLQYGAAGSTKG